MKKLVTASVVLFLFSTQVFAETVYIKERQVSSVRSGPTAEAGVVGQVVTGAGLELIKKTETHAKVRATNGTEGWVAIALITSDKPSAMRILSAETRLKHAQAKVGKLEKSILTLQGKLKTEESGAGEAGNFQESGKDMGLFSGQFSLNLLWIAISFAMLIAGFVVGVIWLRERTRRKLGGMHIRVS